MCLVACSEECLSHPWWLCMCGERCVETSQGPLTQSAPAPERTQFRTLQSMSLCQRCPFLSCLYSLRNCPSGLVFVSFMSNCIPSTFCVQCPTPNPSHPAWLLLLPFLWSSVLKPVMSFCPSGSHDEVEAGCHPELWNGLRWGIQSARDYWWSRSCSAADKFDVSSAISLILRNISGNMSSHGVIWSGDDDTDF